MEEEEEKEGNKEEKEESKQNKEEESKQKKEEESKQKEEENNESDEINSNEELKNQQTEIDKYNEEDGIKDNVVENEKIDHKEALALTTELEGMIYSIDEDKHFKANEEIKEGFIPKGNLKPPRFPFNGRIIQNISTLKKELSHNYKHNIESVQSVRSRYCRLGENSTIIKPIHGQIHIHLNANQHKFNKLETIHCKVNKNELESFRISPNISKVPIHNKLLTSVNGVSLSCMTQKVSIENKPVKVQSIINYYK